MKKTLSILFAIIFAINLNTQAEDFSAVYNGDTIYYKITSSTSPRKVEVTYRGSSITSYSNEYSGAVSIPDSVLYNGYYYKVTSIGYGAFSGCSGLTSITIPNSVTSISNSAFYGCSGLTSITIPDSVTVIGTSVFGRCSGLTSVTIPNSIISIGNSAFNGCSGLTSITIPNSVTSIGSSAFYGCSGLTSITIPDSVTSIGSSAFYGCSGLTSITIPNSVTSIGSRAFRDCSGLTSITIPNSVTSIGDYAFYGCSGLTSITIPNSVTSIGEWAFANCSGLTSITIPNSVTSIGDYAFYGCSGLTSITCQAITPPIITSSSFYNVTKSIPFYVPCASIPSYQSALYWSEFTNRVGLKTAQYINDTICSNETYTNYGANITTAGNYTLVNGCDSVILNLVVHPSFNSFIFAEICQGETYTLNGFNASTAGQHTQNLQTTKGCDSIVNLTLIVNQPAITNLTAEICQGETYTLNGFNVNTAGIHTQNLQTTKGCDSTVNLTLTVNQPAITNLTAEICQGETYTLNGFNVSTAGLHTQDLQTIKGCDSTVNLTLTINQPAITNLTAEICQGETYTLNGFNVSTAGQHTQNLQTIKGCDSTVTLTLTINQPTITNLTAEICQGETYTLNGFNASTAGIHTQNLQTTKGCDSTVYLTLTINQPTITNLTAEICQGETYTLNGFNVNTAGIHTQNLQTTKGCDSTVNLILTINQPAITNLTAEICQGETYTLNGFNVSTSGLHTQNLQTTKGCDSIVNLTLTVNQPAITNLTAEICQGETYTLNGFNASTVGQHTQNLQTINGCDSIVNLSLVVNSSYNDTIYQEICYGETYNQNGFNANTTGIYTQHLQTIKGCDSIVNLNLIVKPRYNGYIFAQICEGETYTYNGFNARVTGFHTQYLQTRGGCDSIVNLYLLVHPSYHDTIFAEICQGETYSQYGFNENTTGFYTQRYQTVKGCDSIVYLALTVKQSTITNLTAEICEGETYTQYGFNENNAGTYTQNLQSIIGCDSTINLTLIVNQPSITNLAAEICEGETYTQYGFNESSTGLYTQNLQTTKGCDSTVNLSLVVNLSYNDTIFATICNGETYTQYGFNESSTGFYTQNLQTTTGCDSLINLSLVVNPSYNDTIFATICNGETYTQYGFNESSTGFYTQNLQTTTGCDSLINLSLFANPSYNDTIFATICQGETYTQYGFNESSTGFYTQNLQTSLGCDSIVNLSLDVIPLSSTEIEMVTVDDNNNNVIIWNKNEIVDHYNIYREGAVMGEFDLLATVPYEAASIYVDTNSNSMVKAYLYKISSINTCSNESELSSLHKTMHLTISQGMGNNWNLIWTPYVGVNYSSYNIYRGINSLDSLEYLATISASNTSYTDMNVPSGYVYYQIEVLMNTNQSKAGESNSIRSNYATNNLLGINDYSLNIISTKLYPNPTEGKAKLEVEGLNSDAEVMVYDMIGRVIQRHKLSQSQKELKIDLSTYAKGIYSIRIVNDSINQTKKLIVQ